MSYIKPKDIETLVRDLEKSLPDCLGSAILYRTVRFYFLPKDTGDVVEVPMEDIVNNTHGLHRLRKTNQ